MLSGHTFLIPKSLVLSQTLLCFFPNDNILAKNWDMWSDRAEYFMFGLSWKPGLWLYTPPICCTLFAALVFNFWRPYFPASLV